MEDLATALDAVDAALGDLVARAFAGDVLRWLSDEDLLAVITAAARGGRHAEALLIEGAGQIEDRSTLPSKEAQIAGRYGCRNASELLQRATRLSSRTVGNLLTAGRAVLRRVAPSSGELLPAEYPAVRAELAAGRVGLDGLTAVVGPLQSVAMVAGAAAHLAADEELAACMRGEGADADPSPCADDLRSMATVWATYLDQDGAEPRETRALRKRSLTLGICRDNLVPVRGNVLPEVGAQLQLIFDSILNPKNDDSDTVPGGPWFTESTDDEPRIAQAETRTRAQRQHDAFATVLFKIAGSGALPSLGGAAPTLVVSVRAGDMTSGRGYAHIDGITEPVSLSFARHIGCSGSIQRVTSDERGRIIGIETSDRVFNGSQRKAIGLRDGGCVIPGCHVPVSWCEIHHVAEHAKGGPTHTDNGVLLCWYHHRTIDDGLWRVRMNRGIPEIRGPNWWDATGRWRPASTAPTRMRDRVSRRT
ncbi:HNH endonuclease signature motif containing protein [Microbacterium rhizomatis]|nr:HNH endonuclease signature motif containing protein [Microbacterium rhizomatis]